MTTGVDEAYFWQRVQRPDGFDGCWTFKGYINSYGYAGMIRWPSGSSQRRSPHRLSYELTTGTTLDRKQVIDHVCRNRACINPAHLEATTQRENMRRGITAQRTHCKQGHEFTPENTYYYKTPLGNGRRRCRACGRINNKRMRDRWREEGQGAPLAPGDSDAEVLSAELYEVMRVAPLPRTEVAIPYSLLVRILDELAGGRDYKPEPESGKAEEVP